MSLDENSYDDWVEFINIILFVATLLLGFASQIFMCGLSRDTILQVDEDIIRGERIAGDETYFSIESLSYFHAGSMTILCLFSSTWVAIWIQLSFTFGAPRGDIKRIKRWASVGKYFVMLAYLLCLVGIIFFYQIMHEWTILSFPDYPSHSVYDKTLYDPAGEDKDGNAGVMKYIPSKYYERYFYFLSRSYQGAVYLFCFLSTVLFIWFMSRSKRAIAEQDDVGEARSKYNQCIDKFTDMHLNSVISEEQLATLIQTLHDSSESFS